MDEQIGLLKDPGIHGHSTEEFEITKAGMFGAVANALSGVALNSERILNNKPYTLSMPLDEDLGDVQELLENLDKAGLTNPVVRSSILVEKYRTQEGLEATPSQIIDIVISTDAKVLEGVEYRDLGGGLDARGDYLIQSGQDLPRQEVITEAMQSAGLKLKEGDLGHCHGFVEGYGPGVFDFTMNVPHELPSGREVILRFNISENPIHTPHKDQLSGMLEVKPVEKDAFGLVQSAHAPITGITMDKHGEIRVHPYFEEDAKAARYVQVRPKAYGDQNIAEIGAIIPDLKAHEPILGYKKRRQSDIDGKYAAAATSPLSVLGNSGHRGDTIGREDASSAKPPVSAEVTEEVIKDAVESAVSSMANKALVNTGIAAVWAVSAFLIVSSIQNAVEDANEPVDPNSATFEPAIVLQEDTSPHID